jgi:DNA adenine methylase
MTDADHEMLLEYLQSLKGMVMVSGYPHPMYDDALSGWKRVEKKALAGGSKDKERIEVLWINPAAVAVTSRERLI